MRNKITSYRKIIAFVADNDEPGLNAVDDIVEKFSTALVAEAFGRDYLDVANDIVRHRQAHGDYIALALTGSRDDSPENLADRRVHFVPLNTDMSRANSVAICGAAPTGSSQGWSLNTSDSVTCPRCKSALRKYGRTM